MTCPSCNGVVLDGSRFCPSCGAPLSLSATPTGTAAEAPSASVPPVPKKTPSGAGHSPSSSTPSLDRARFVPGTLLAERYRIVALAGKGGMGEVYRAEDLKLGQTVALKFLPEILKNDAEALSRFHREVRVARQVSHPNVCRVFDVGETDGYVFLTMEYVDGEDLASLLRRIGRLPQDKAVEIARQLCAGLAASHEYGVLHRDLKPSNVMIDGRGKARITDFGLAGIAEDFGKEDLRAGTPAYMAPEQLEGKEVTVRSDLFALGLVLYELFTGKRAFQTPLAARMKDLEAHSTPTSPSSLVKDLDPAIERVILRCLEREPARRPASALQVAAALPGGDPLAAALAAGETPSPEMVAASGETEGLRPGIAWACFAGILVCALAAAVLSAYTKLYRLVPLEKTPDALAEKARDVLRSAGHTERPADTAVGFVDNVEFVRYIAKNDSSPMRWKNLEEGMGFWYRSSPRPLEAKNILGNNGPPGTVGPHDPPLDQSGMTLVWLTPRGNVRSLLIVPPQVEQEASASLTSVDWTPLFAAAGLEPSQWKLTPSTWTPPVYSDTRAAWTGALPERPDIPMRIEAGAYRGRPVYFELIGPWTRPERMQPYKPTTGERSAQAIGAAIALTLGVVGLLLALRNLRMGRGDRKGATRLAVFTLVALQMSWLAGTHHVPSFHEFILHLMSLGTALSIAGSLWIFYVALEPYVRRRWPATLVSWTRLLAGRWRDPIVGRDILAGSLLGAFTLVVTRTLLAMPTWFGQIPLQPYGGVDRQFLGGRFLISDLAGSIVASALVPMLVGLFLLFLCRLVLRKDWLAGLAYIVLTSASEVLISDTPVVRALSLIIINCAEVVLLIRFGLLAVIATGFLNHITGAFPLTTDLSAWYVGISFAALLLVAAVAFYGFYFSLGGRPLFGPAKELEE